MATPDSYLPQGIWAENIFEVHKSGWIIGDFQKYNIAEYRVLRDNLFENNIQILVVHLRK